MVAPWQRPAAPSCATGQSKSVKHGMHAAGGWFRARFTSFAHQPCGVCGGSGGELGVGGAGGGASGSGGDGGHGGLLG